MVNIAMVCGPYMAGMTMDGVGCRRTLDSPKIGFR